jgi:hypothetical protein
VIFRSCDSRNHHTIFKFVWEILPIQPTIQTRGKKSAPPLFLKDENVFQKSAPLVWCGIEFPTVLTELIFEENVLIFEKKGGGGGC